MSDCKWWGRDGDEVLWHTDANECIEFIIDALHPEPINELDAITVNEYVETNEPHPWIEGSMECVQTGKSITVNPLKWVQENRPDWLKKTQENDV